MLPSSAMKSSAGTPWAGKGTVAESAVAPMASNEVEEAFLEYWRLGAVGEDWPAWADLFTEDATYVEHVLGTMHGRDEIKQWIVKIMDDYSELYTAYEWHMVDGNRVVVYMQN